MNIMTPEAQRIAIAEVCGWTNCEMYLGTYAGELYDFPIGTSPTGFTKVRIPDYLNDLNAMHEAENHLLDISDGVPLPDAWAEYCMYLKLQGCLAIHATAAQRAEAFLRTLGLWKSS